jgi:hypothetical protein
MARHLVVQLGEPGADCPHRLKPERRAHDAPRQQRLARAERDRAHLHVQLVEQSLIVELPGQVAAAHDPDVLARGRRAHRLMHRPHVAAGEPDVSAREKPSRLEAV